MPGWNARGERCWRADANHVVKVLGESFVLHMRRATDDAIFHVDATVDSNQAVARRFHVAMKRLYPKHSIIKLKPVAASDPHVEEDAA
jgi:hypothetical protein